MRLRLVPIVLCGVMSLVAAPARGGEGTRSADMHVSVTVIRGCSVSTESAAPSKQPRPRVQLACAKGVATPRVDDTRAPRVEPADADARPVEGGPAFVLINF